MDGSVIDCQNGSYCKCLISMNEKGEMFLSTVPWCTLSALAFQFLQLSVPVT
jgi:hypothetical protein